MSLTQLGLTVLDSFRTPYKDSALDLHEHRMGTYGMLEMFKRDSANLLPVAKIAAARAAGSRPITVPVIKTKDYSLTTTRACAAITNANESALVTLVWGTYQWGFHMIPSQYGNNMIGMEDDFARKMLDSQTSVLKALEALCYTKLNTDKSQVNAADGKPFAFTGNTIIFPKAGENLVLNELDVIMGMNNINPRYNLVATRRFNALVNYQKNQGAGNATALDFQFGNFDIGYSNQLTLSANARDTFFVMPKGSCAFIPWVDRSSEMGEKSATAQWSKVMMPQLGFEVGLKISDGCGDNSTEAGAGFEASNKINYVFSFDYSLVTAYNSDPTSLAGSIFKGDILSS